MKLSVRVWPDPVLLTACEPWDFATPPVSDIDQFETDMIETMLAERGIGLAANQVGYTFRALAIHLQENGQAMVMYNPTIKHTSQEQWFAPEGCLSFPGIELEISRPKFVTAQWQDRDGEWNERMLSYVDAKCFLHELEHLNGRVFKDHVSDLKFQRAQKKSPRQ
jgi:peptide deformylase